MSGSRARLDAILDAIEHEYGAQKRSEPRDAFGLLVHRNSGYPPSDANCGRGFAALKTGIGVEPDAILAAPVRSLRAALRAGGIVPELRAERLREIATRVREEFGGDLRKVLKLPLTRARKVLRSFPTISDAGADKILLFTRAAPVAALPSECLHVPLRLGYGSETKSWSAGYRSAQEANEAELAEGFEPRMRAYLLLKRLAHEVCKRSKPLCGRCPVASRCAYFRGLGSAAGR
jgi:endonuclease III